jgi:hypothetical protein
MRVADEQTAPFIARIREHFFFGIGPRVSQDAFAVYGSVSGHP